MEDGRDNAGRAVGGSGDHASAGSVLFVHRDGVHGDPVEGRERVVYLSVGFELRDALVQTWRSAAHVEAARENAAGGHAAFGRELHRAPEREDALLDLIAAEICGGKINVGPEDSVCGGALVGFEQGALIGEDEVGDGELMSLRDGEEFSCAGEWIWNSARGDLLFFRIARELFSRDDEAPADGVEDALGKDAPVSGEGGEAHAVRVRFLGVDAGRSHRVAAEDQIAGFVEGDDVGAAQLQLA